MAFSVAGVQIKDLSRLGPAAAKAILDKWRRAFCKPVYKINIDFISNKDYPVEEVGIFLRDIIIVRFKSGELQIIPKGMVGKEMKKWFGYRFRHITHWGILPSASSKYSFRGGRKRGEWMQCAPGELMTDLYDEMQEYHGRSKPHQE